jgi:prophage DNA circulation protein
MADVLTGVSSFRWKDLDLAGNLVSWNDTIRVRLAAHVYLKRTGAEIEPMGAEPGHFTMRLCFLGSDWAKQYRAFVGSVRKDPRGQMVHPLLGTMRVACEGISDAAVTPGSERDSINLTVSFIEDQVDTTLANDQFPGPAAKQGQVSKLATQVTSAIATYATAITAGVALTGAAISFAADAAASASSNTPDPSLEQQLAAVATNAASAIAALLSDPAAVTDASSYDAISLVEQLYAACLALADAVAASKPIIVEYVVPGTTDIATLAAKLYGPDAFDRLDEILTLNRIANPFAIPAGTVLRVATPTLG